MKTTKYLYPYDVKALVSIRINLFDNSIVIKIYIRLIKVL